MSGWVFILLGVVSLLIAVTALWQMWRPPPVPPWSRLNTRALRHRRAGRLARAERDLRRALDLAESARHGQRFDDPDAVATVCGNLANVLRDQRRHEESEELFLRSILLYELHPRLHWKRRFRESELARLYHDWGRPAAEEEALRRATGFDHPDDFGPPAAFRPADDNLRRLADVLRARGKTADLRRVEHLLAARAADAAACHLADSDTNALA